MSYITQINILMCSGNPMLIVHVFTSSHCSDSTTLIQAILLYR